ncbi:MAG TPA: hypothetical protein VGF59_12580 [Bryobacteraceae bacterium]|jgi:hypothetical protein
MRLPLRYRVAQKGVIDRMGTGMTYEMGANGLSFRCRKPLPVGAHIDAVIDWPARYEDIHPVDLQVTGFVVRSDAGRTAVRLTSRRFRVNHAQPLPASA